MIIDAFSSPHRKKFSSSGVSVARIIVLVLIVHGLFLWKAEDEWQAAACTQIAHLIYVICPSHKYK